MQHRYFGVLILGTSLFASSVFAGRVLRHPHHFSGAKLDILSTFSEVFISLHQSGSCSLGLAGFAGKTPLPLRDKSEVSTKASSGLSFEGQIIGRIGGQKNIKIFFKVEDQIVTRFEFEKPEHRELLVTLGLLPRSDRSLRSLYVQPLELKDRWLMTWVTGEDSRGLPAKWRVEIPKKPEQHLGHIFISCVDEEVRPFGLASIENISFR